MSDDDDRERPRLPSHRRPPRMDEPLKVVFREHAAELADLIGEAGASVLSSRSLELNTLMRRLDCVLELRRGGEVHYRVVGSRPACAAVASDASCCTRRSSWKR